MGNFKLNGLSFFIIVLILFRTVTAVGQVYQEIEELSEVSGDFEEITGVQQDNLGNLWVASNTHILKYNSAVSEVYNYFRGIPENSGNLNTIFIDSRNRVWAGSEKGLLRYDSHEEKFSAIPSKNSNLQPNVQQISEDEEGTIWLGASNGIWKYSGEKLGIIATFPAEQKVNSLLVVNRQVIFGTSKGLFSLNRGSSHYDKISLLSYKDLNIESLLFADDFFLIGTNDDGLYKTNLDFSRTEKIYSLPYSSQKLPLSAIVQDRTGHFYISTRGDGLIILDQNLKLINQHRLQDGSGSTLMDSHIDGLYADAFSTLWIYTDSGQLHSLNIRQKYFEFLRNDPQKYASLADNVTSAIEKDTNGNVWFGTREGLSIWNIKNNSWQHLKNLSFTQPGNEPDIIKDLQADGEHMWVATYNDGLYKVNINTFLRAHFSIDSKTKTKLQKVNAVVVDDNKNIWAGGDEGGIIKIQANGEIVDFAMESIDAMHQLSSGEIIAAGKKGVFSLKPGGKDFRAIDKLAPGWDDLPYFTVNSITETATGEMVLATEGAGIVIYDPVKEEYKKMNRSTGLPSNRIRGLITNGRDEIWAGTSRGLIFLELKEEPAVRIFNKDAGLLSPVFTRGSYARLENQLAFGTYQGVSIFDPENIKATPEIAPRVILGSIELKTGKEKQLEIPEQDKKIELAHNQNSFNFTFYSTGAGLLSNIEYSWKLEGFDDEWSSPQERNGVSYANLSPGDYTFLVRARKTGGPWSEVEKASFEIASPWWMSTTAYFVAAGVLLLFLAIPFALFHILKKRRLKAAKNSFINKMSQEMSTSLTVLLASLDTVAEEEEVKNKYRLKNIINRLQELLDPILNFNPEGLNKNKRQPKISGIVISQYMQDLVKDLDPLLKQKRLEIIINDQWNKENFFYDVDYLNKIFFNILSNCINYSFNEGKIIINLIQTNKGDLKVQIADNGVGLPFEDQKIIKEYYRNSRRGTIKGSAGQINLLYVKDFIDKLGGSIVFESSKDQGTTFTLILKNQSGKVLNALPQKPIITEQKIEEKPEEKWINEPQEKIVAEPLAQQVEVNPVKILIAEDNDELRKVFAESFKKLGEVYEAKSSMEAFEVIIKEQPSIIIADFAIRGMNGFAFYKALKKESALLGSVFYLLVSQNEKVQLPETDEEDFQFISKPVNINALYQLISGEIEHSENVPHVNTRLSERNSRLLKGSLDQEFTAQLQKVLIGNIQHTTFSEEDLATAMGITVTSLRTKIKNSEGIAPHEFILRTRLNYAKALISDGNSDLAEVARQAGFPNKDVFFSAFKRHFGFMPGTIMSRF